MDSQTLHQALLDPRTFNLAEVSITFKETHISRLYFVGERVYKLKKPVDFGFLDFTTLDKRKFFCEEEVRLNQRFSKGIYLGVVEIREHDGRLSIEGPGRTVEYAVMMKRLPDSAMLPRLLETADPALPERMAALARHIAACYRELESFGPDSGEDHLAVVEHNWQENFSQTEPYIGKTISAHAFALLRDYVLDFQRQHADLFHRREAEGWIRDGHGDLHCEHICFLDGGIAIYDCIEFNRRFRIADVLADLAFLLMDLELRGRYDLALTVRENYLAVMGRSADTDLLIPFYQIYRAYVRGKVDSFLSSDPHAAEANRRAAATRAERYFNQALGYLCRTPRMILTCGLMGAGKTTVARHLATPLGARLLRSDEYRKKIAGISTRERCHEGFGEGIYDRESTTATYDALLEDAVQTLQSGRTAIVDASFADRSQRQRFREAAEQAGYEAWTVEVACDRKIALQRLDQREREGLDASDGRRELYDRQARAFEPIEKEPRVLRTDGNAPLDQAVSDLLCSMQDG